MRRRALAIRIRERYRGRTSSCGSWRSTNAGGTGGVALHPRRTEWCDANGGLTAVVVANVVSVWTRSAGDAFAAIVVAHVVVLWTRGARHQLATVVVAARLGRGTWQANSGRTSLGQRFVTNAQRGNDCKHTQHERAAANQQSHDRGAGLDFAKESSSGHNVRFHLSYEEQPSVAEEASPQTRS